MLRLTRQYKSTLGGAFRPLNCYTRKQPANGFWGLVCGLNLQLWPFMLQFLECTSSIIFRAPQKLITPHRPSDLLARNRLAMPTKVGVAPAQGFLKWCCQGIEYFHTYCLAVVSCHTLQLCSKFSGFLGKTTCLKFLGLPKSLSLGYADSAVIGHNWLSY